MDEQNRRPQDGTRAYQEQTREFDPLKDDRTMIYDAPLTDSARGQSSRTRTPMRNVEEQTQARRAVRNQSGPARTHHYVPDIRSEEERMATDKKEHKRRDKIKRRKNRHVFSVMWVLMVVLLSLTISKYLISGSNDFFGVNRVHETVTVEIPENVTIDQLTDILYSKQVINKPEFFRLYCNLTTDVDLFREGTFQIETDMDYEGIINYLQSEGELETVEVTFYEGMNVLQMAQLLEENGVCTADEFTDAINNNDFSDYWCVKDIDTTEGTYYKLEGYLFPNQYQFYANGAEDLDSIIGKMLNSFEDNLENEDLVDAIKKSGYSYREIITLASIIQAEAKDVDDMYMISAVLHNRLESGSYYDIHTLGCDSTSYYPYRTKEDVPADIRDTFKSTYDTYVIEGLPAGPICNPGLDAIKAALNPSPDGAYYYYFGHHSDGTPYYSTTLEEHEYQRDSE